MSTAHTASSHALQNNSNTNEMPPSQSASQPSSRSPSATRGLSPSTSASPLLKLALESSASLSAHRSPAAHRPPILDLSPANNHSPPHTLPSSPSQIQPSTKRFHSLPHSQSQPAQSPHTGSPHTNNGPPLSFRLKLSALEVQSPHAEPIILGSPPSVRYSNTVPSPRAIAVASSISAVPRLLLPVIDDESTSSPSSKIGTPVPVTRPNIPSLPLQLNQSPLNRGGAVNSARSQRNSLNMGVVPMTDSPRNALQSQSANLSHNSHDRAKKLAYFSTQCTSLTDYLYVSGKTVAEDLSLLKSVGITHIVNLIGDLMENCFPSEFVYQRWFLLDHAGEDILCVLYPVIEFIEQCNASGGKVLVHCQQGVSRSCVLCIGYLMLANNWDYEQAFQYVRARRGICRPNVGFMCQLIAWRKRLTAKCHPLSLYRLAPHSQRDRCIVPKLVDRVDSGGLDDRGVFVLHSATALYIWIGVDCHIANIELYYPQAMKLIERLQRFERAPSQVYTLYQKDERAKGDHSVYADILTSVYHRENESNNDSNDNDSVGHNELHSSTSSPSLSVDATPTSSLPSTPIAHTPHQNPSYRFWSLISGSPFVTHLNSCYEDYEIPLLAELPARPASVPLPALATLRSATAPADQRTYRAVAFQPSVAQTMESDESDSVDFDNREHKREESEMLSAINEARTDAAPLTRRRSYHKSIDNTYLHSAEDHQYAQSGDAYENDRDELSQSMSTNSDNHGVSHGERLFTPRPPETLSSRVNSLSVGRTNANTDNDNSDLCTGRALSFDSSDDSSDDFDLVDVNDGINTASLYSYPSFENLDHYDSDDLRSDGIFVLLMLGEEAEEDGHAVEEQQGDAAQLPPAQCTLHVWFGSLSTPPLVQQASQQSQSIQSPSLSPAVMQYETFAELIAIEFVRQFHPLKRDVHDNVKVVVEYEGSESPAFWAAFKEG